MNLLQLSFRFLTWLLCVCFVLFVRVGSVFSFGFDFVGLVVLRFGI